VHGRRQGGPHETRRVEGLEHTGARMTARPLPCPFCGKLSWQFYRDPGTWATQVECAVCGARGPRCIPDEAEALAAWNERSSPPAKPGKGAA